MSAYQDYSIKRERIRKIQELTLSELMTIQGGWGYCTYTMTPADSSIEQKETVLSFDENSCFLWAQGIGGANPTFIYDSSLDE